MNSLLKLKIMHNNNIIDVYRHVNNTSAYEMMPFHSFDFRTKLTYHASASMNV
jgi:hypothetical protein